MRTSKLAWAIVLAGHAAHAQPAPLLYGFVELDGIADSTQSFNELAGNAPIARTGTYAGDHGRGQMSVRNSRLGFKLSAPEYDGMRTSAQLEMDFLGNQPATSEASLYGSPTFRIRHFDFRIESGVVDVLVGQYWSLFGWQSYFGPNSVQIQGVPGQVYSRVPQLRLSKTLAGDGWALDLAIAASRPANRDSAVPDGEAGIRLVDTEWTGWHTMGATGAQLDALALGVSAIARDLRVVDFSGASKSDHATGWGVSLDALVPIIRATKTRHDNAFTVNGSFVLGDGIADQYTNLTGGAGFPTPMAPATYTPDVDPGLVTFDASRALTAIEWRSFLVGAQYYLGAPRLWLSANYSQMSSSNIGSLGLDPTKAFSRSRWADANLFWDLTPAVRLGAEYACSWQRYVDGNEPVNRRVQLSAFFLF